jgi:hypothetical protein
MKLSSFALAILGAACLACGAAAAPILLAGQDAPVQFSGGCTVEPISFESAGTNLAFWTSFFEPYGVLASRWTDPDQVPQPQLLIPGDGIAFAAGPNPAGFVVAWRRFADSLLHFRIYGPNLLPVQPVNDVGTTAGQPALEVEANGDFAIAWVDPVQGLLVRRFFASGDPATPVVPVAAGGEPYNLRVVLGDQGFLVIWNDLLPGNPLRVRGFSPAGAPLGAVVDLGMGFVEGAPVSDGYLVLSSEENLASRLLASDGQPLAPEVPLGGPAFQVRSAAAAPDFVWLAWIEGDGRLMGAALDELGLFAIPPTPLVEPFGNNFPFLSSLVAVPEGFRLTWSLGIDVPIPVPCSAGADGGMTQDFGPAAIVDVPMLSNLGLALCALMFAIAGALLHSHR